MERREDRALLIRIAVAGAIAGNVMLLAFALYGGYFHGISDEYRNLFRWVSLALTLPSVLWCAQLFYRGAWGALRTARDIELRQRSLPVSGDRATILPVVLATSTRSSPLPTPPETGVSRSARQRTAPVC